MKTLVVRKKPVLVKAIEVDDSLLDKLPIEINGRKVWKDRDEIVVETLEGHMRCKKGDFLIIGVKGEIYPIRRNIFFETYEVVGTSELEENNEKEVNRDG